MPEEPLLNIIRTQSDTIARLQTQIDHLRRQLDSSIDVLLTLTSEVGRITDYLLALTEQLRPD